MARATPLSTVELYNKVNPSPFSKAIGVKPSIADLQAYARTQMSTAAPAPTMSVNKPVTPTLPKVSTSLYSTPMAPSAPLKSVPLPTTPSIPKIAPGPSTPAVPKISSVQQSIKPGPQSVGTYIPPTPAAPPATGTINPNTGGMTQAPTPTMPDLSALGNANATYAATPTPAIPTPDPRIAAAEEAYRKSTEMTPEEQANAESLSQLEQSYRQGYANAADQTIPLEFITGQQASQERRMLNLQQPLKDRAALLQAKRLASMEASKFALERLDKSAAAAEEKNKPVSVGEGTSLVQRDPVTGAYRSVFAAPVTAKPEKRDTQIVEANGRRILVDTQTGETITDIGSTTDGEANYDKLLSVDEAQKLGVPYGSTVRDAMGATPKEDQAMQQASDALSAVSALAEMPGLNAAVGPISSRLPTLFGDTADFEGQLDRVKSLLTLPALQQLRGLGAMSDREFATLSTSVAALNKNMSQEGFKTELTRIKDALQSTVDAPLKKAYQTQGFTESYNQAVEKYGRDGLRTILQQSGAFNKDLSTSKNGSIADKLTASIAQHESGGRQLSGASGEFGIFQFLPATWKTISSQYLKANNLPPQNLKQSAQNEIAVARWKIQQLLDSGRTPREVALIWNTSLGGSEKPLVRKGVNSQGVAYDSGAYANAVLGNFNRS